MNLISLHFKIINRIYKNKMINYLMLYNRQSLAIALRCCNVCQFKSLINLVTDVSLE